jgi:hypothetical protein
VATTPYSTVAPFFDKAAVPQWTPESEVERVASYGVYDDIYWNVPGTFKLVLRGTESLPIYVPNARTIVDTTNRYTATGASYTINQAVGPAEQQASFQLALDDLFVRERFWTKFHLAKREGLRRGDWLIHLVADPNKPAGSRLSIYTVDPRTYFPVEDPENPDRILKVHLAEQYVVNDHQYVRRQTYFKEDGTGRIVSQTLVQEFDEFKKGSDVAVKRQEVLLPPEITAIPVYHIKNQEETSNPFGSSELRGFERIMSAINQSVSDEDIALALEGLGMYATDAGKPVIEQVDAVSGKVTQVETDWVLGPGRVIEVPIGSKFERVTGISTVQPQQDHIAFLINSLREGAAITDAAMGKVDVTIAESGVSLLMQLAPMLAHVDEKDQNIAEILGQFFFDLRNWYAAYEGLNFQQVRALPVFGDKIPPNKRQVLEDTLMMLEAVPPLISVQTAHRNLSKVGYDFDVEEIKLIAADAKLRVAAQTAAATATDPQARIQQEIDQSASANNAA